MNAILLFTLFEFSPWIDHTKMAISSLAVIFNQKLELSANQKGLHSKICTNEIWESLKMIWHISKNRPPAMSILLSWIEIDMTSFYVFGKNMWKIIWKIENGQCHAYSMMLMQRTEFILNNNFKKLVTSFIQKTLHNQILLSYIWTTINITHQVNDGLQKW